MVVLANIVKSPIIVLAAAAAVLLLASFIATPAHAQTPSVTASVDRTDLTLSDVLTLTLRIEGVSNVHPLPQAPVIDGMVLVGNERRSRQSFVQGTLSAQFEFKFMYQPLRAGAVVIDPIKVILDNTVHVTKSITVNVTGGNQTTQQPATSNPQPSSLVGQDFFAESEVDDETPYIGQQITYSLRFYSANAFARPIYDAPDFAGFWNPGRSSEQESVTDVAGRSYKITEINTILFPTLAGDIKIEPTNVSVRGGLLGSSVTEYPTRQIDLRVRPLPTNEPDAFTGAVGRYSMDAEIDSYTVGLGEPVTLTLTVSGEGNMESLPAPIWPDIPGWRAFDNDAPYQMSIIDGKVQGARKFQRVLIPNASGSHLFPPIEYAYFDPYIGEYVTLTSRSLRVEVLSDPGSLEAELPASSAVGSEETAPDIRYIKPEPGSLGRSQSPLTSSNVFWGLWLTPIAGIVAVGAWLAFTRRRATSSNAREDVRARETVLSRLANIEPGASASDAASMALHGYLDARLGRSTAGLSAEEIAGLLNRRGVESDTSDLLVSLLNRLSEMRFAPYGSRVRGNDEGLNEEIGREVEAIVRKLDEEFAAPAKRLSEQ